MQRNGPSKVLYKPERFDIRVYCVCLLDFPGKKPILNV